ncbi:hypothetical protein HED63_22390 [Ochrobactrum cytisi]|nr:hypothetical protein [Brucella cytisi]
MMLTSISWKVAGILDWGAAMLVGSARTGIALTPSLIPDSLQPDDGVHIA